MRRQLDCIESVRIRKLELMFGSRAKPEVVMREESVPVGDLPAHNVAEETAEKVNGSHHRAPPPLAAHQSPLNRFND